MLVLFFPWKPWIRTTRGSLLIVPDGLTAIAMIAIKRLTFLGNNTLQSFQLNQFRISLPASLCPLSISNPKMKTFIASLALPLLAAAAPAMQTREANPPFSVMAIRSASPIHYSQMNAAGQKFYLGGKTSSYCPDLEGITCPPGNQTVIAGGGSALVCYTTLLSTNQN